MTVFVVVLVGDPPMISRESGYFSAAACCELARSRLAGLAGACVATRLAARGDGAAAPTIIEINASDPMSVADCLRLGLEWRRSGSRIASMRPSNSLRRAIASATDGVA